jgi:hypothetical protein
VAYALEALQGAYSDPGTMPSPAPPRRRSRLRPFAVALAILAAASGGLMAGRRLAERPDVRVRPLTFRRGGIWDARFAPDGKTVVYSAGWDGGLPELYSTRVESPESKSLGLPSAGLSSISPRSELAILLHEKDDRGWPVFGTLASVPLSGGAPRALLNDVASADWAPNGDLCVLRLQERSWQIEMPVGKVLYQSQFIQSDQLVRVSPAGDLVAFTEWDGDTSTRQVRLVDRSGKVTTIWKGYQPMGSAWHRHARELWVAVMREGGMTRMIAVSPTGRERLLHDFDFPVFLHDVAPGGEALVNHGIFLTSLLTSAPGEATERELSLFDSSLPVSLARDGKLLMIVDRSALPGPATYIRPMDGGPAIRLRDGAALDLSPDGKWALFLEPGPPKRLVQVPTGVGEPRPVSLGEIEPLGGRWSRFDGSLLVEGKQPGKKPRIFRLDSEGGPKPITPEGISGPCALSPDGSRLAVFMGSPDSRLALYPVAGGEPRALMGSTAFDGLLGWSSDGRWIYVRRGRASAPARVERIEVTTGRREPWKEFMPADATGIGWVSTPEIALDGRAYAYANQRFLTNLFVVDGLR